MHDEYKAWLVKQRAQQVINADARRQARNQKLIKSGVKFVAKKLFLHGLANMILPVGGSYIVEGISYLDPTDAWDMADAADAMASAGDIDVPVSPPTLSRSCIPALKLMVQQDWDALDLDTVDLAFSIDPPDLTELSGRVPCSHFYVSSTRSGFVENILQMDG